MAGILAREERERTKKTWRKKKLSETLKMVLKFLFGGHALLDGRSHAWILDGHQFEAKCSAHSNVMKHEVSML